MGKIISNGIEYGGLIKVEGALIKEIWVNDNVQPIGEFSINLDLSDYDFVGFRFEQNTSDMGKITPIQIVKNELGEGTVFIFNASGGSNAVIGRSATITSTGITFSDGYVPNVGYYNNLLIPITIYGIQQGSGANNGGIDYSTTEQKTGQKWINGKDIYQKTVHLESGDFTIGDRTNGISNGLSNVETIITKDAIGIHSNGSGTAYFSNYFPTSDSFVCQIFDIGATEFSIYVGSGFSSMTDIYVTFQYTKSTT